MKFETTHWDLVRDAQLSGEQADEAMAVLCERYWKPLYMYTRYRGHSEQDAQDIVQGFFLRVIDKGYFDAADSSKGRFRTFLLTCLQRYMANEYNRAVSVKRGGSMLPIPIPWPDGESDLLQLPSHLTSADVLFDRQWALVIIGRAMERLKAGERRAGRGQLVDAVGPHLVTALAETDYEELAKRLGTTRGAARVAMHRLRKRLGVYILEEVGQTVGNPEDAEAELQLLLQALGS